VNCNHSKTDLTKEIVFTRRYKENELSALLDGFTDIEYGIQAQSFLGEPHLIQSFWHVFGRKSVLRIKR